jgi:hypothetical protein
MGYCRENSIYQRATNKISSIGDITMKMINYRLQNEIENLKVDKKDWFKNSIRQILESDKPYYVKADYIGLSIKELDNKISYIADDIKELQTLKKHLTVAKTTALEVTAEVLAEYGIDRLDGTSISSITITPPKSKTKDIFKIIDSDALIQLGYMNVVVDENAVKEAMCTLEGMNEVDKFIETNIITENIPARIKINSKRNSEQNSNITEILTIDNNQAA